MQTRLRKVRSTSRRSAGGALNGSPANELGILTLQRLAGNQATTDLLLRFVGAGVAATTRPTVKKGDVDQAVGVLQEKLNVLGEKLVIDAEFGGKTLTAVIRFQRAHPPLKPNGVFDQDSWVVLDGLVSGGDVKADGSLSPTLGKNTPDPTGKVDPNSDVKPELRQGSKGVAVEELHEKLNRLGASLPTVTKLTGAETLEFTADTDVAVRDFQRAHKLGVDGVVGIHTWAALDKLSPGASMGRVDKFAKEHARGKTFGTSARYDWALEPDLKSPTTLRIRVRYDYQDDPKSPVPDHGTTSAALLNGIKSIWNHFKAVEQPTTPGAPLRSDITIEFDPQEAKPADKAVVLSSADGHSNASEYFIHPGDDLAGLSAHEFGHHFGLEDEYQQTAADHLRQTGEAAPVGDVKGDGTNPEVIAREMGTALRTPPRATHGDRALDVINAHNLTQGAFAQQVADRYLKLFGISVVADCNRLIDEKASEGDMTTQRRCTQPFLYTEMNLMGGAESEDADKKKGTNHDHDVAPRHVRHLCALISDAVGGKWEPAVR